MFIILIIQSSSQSCPSGYTLCAREAGSCSIPSYIQQGYISYGASGRFILTPFSNTKNDGSNLITRCDNDFGDVRFGTVKYCCFKSSNYVLDISRDSGYIAEGQSWNFGAANFINRNIVMRYGANEKYFYRVFAGSIGYCNNNYFNDPIYGQYKHCNYYTSPLGTAKPLPSPISGQWKFCSDENTDCSGLPPRTETWIRYGANGKYHYKYVMPASDGRIPCDNAVFDDPIRGTPKDCWKLL